MDSLLLIPDCLSLYKLYFNLVVQYLILQKHIVGKPLFWFLRPPEINLNLSVSGLSKKDTLGDP